MANDPQPTGFITLNQAFGHYLDAWEGRDPDDRRAQILAAFAEGALVAVVNFPDRAGSFSIPSKAWSEGPFPDRVFLTDDIVEHAHDAWAAYRGGTPFVEELSFSGWLARNRPLPPPNPEDYDPTKLPIWSLTMAVGWIATRSIETVRWQINDWRNENGDGQSSLALASIGLDDNEPHPMFFRSLPAFEVLRLACMEGDPVARAIASDTGRVQAISRDDWAYGALTFGGDLQEIWSAPGLTYRQITVSRDDLFRLWPEENATATNTPTRPRKAGRPKGSTNWPEQELFIAEFVRRLIELGKPSRVKPEWDSWETARSLVLEWFIKELPEPTEPSPSTAKGWEKLARERWQAMEKSEKSENPIA